jgi:hypothetical protein
MFKTAASVSMRKCSPWTFFVDAEVRRIVILSPPGGGIRLGAADIFSQSTEQKYECFYHPGN